MATSSTTKEVRATYSDTTVRVYQAYNPDIATAAVQAQHFVAPWIPGRMTWIKPSAIWMGYRSGWASKDANQARILAIDLHRAGFDWLLENAALAKSQAPDARHDIIVQWDPERALGNGPQGSPPLKEKDAYTHAVPLVRSIQIGLRGAATAKYGAGGLIAHIEDVTENFATIGALLAMGDIEGAAKLLPAEEVYPLPPDLAILKADVKTAEQDEKTADNLATIGGDVNEPKARQSDEEQNTPKNRRWRVNEK
eukprot:GEMP01084168.1.p1 GENE.GEMP01084168.1~~GEMP01084168.1.p1  ORF type:complete len:268 (+),score=70.20 GEMP01084168.1:47-805(+)